MAQITLNSTGVASSGALTLQSNGTTNAVTVDTSQNVGIGTSSPAYKLDLTNAASPNARINGTYTVSSKTYSSLLMGTTGTSQGAQFGYVYDSGTIANSFAHITPYGSGEGSALVVSTGGNVGIGSTSPTFTNGKGISILDGTTSRLKLATTASGSGATDGFELSCNGSEAYIYNYENSFMAFGTNSTERMRLDSSGNLSIGATSTTAKLLAAGAGNNILGNAYGVASFVQDTTTARGVFIGYDSTGQIGTVSASSAGAASILAFWTYSGSAWAEKARIDSSGNLLVGTTSATAGAVFKVTGATANSISHQVWSTASSTNAAYWTEGSSIVNGVATGANSSGTMIRINKDSGNTRSINAAGTINASGADYAEYMTKAGDFTVAKGDVVGIDTNGKLTNVFADAVSFMVKSTEPSYVGGDSWGVGFEDDAEGLEAARQRVDRIAFAGQVPVNVTGATAGQYIIPVNNNGAIKGQAVSNPTFEQYQTAVGKVIAIESDGRAKIIVKVA